MWRRGEKRAKGRRSNTESLKPCNFVELRNAPPPWTTVNGRSAPTVSLSFSLSEYHLLFLPAISLFGGREKERVQFARVTGDVAITMLGESCRFIRLLRTTNRRFSSFEASLRGRKSEESFGKFVSCYDFTIERIHAEHLIINNPKFSIPFQSLPRSILSSIN